MRDTASDFRGFLELLWLRKWVVLGTALLAVAAAVYLSSQRTPSYTSETKVLVESVALSATDSTQALVPNMDTEAELADSTATAELVVKSLDLRETPTELLDHLGVALTPSTNIMGFTYSDPVPSEAQRRADAFAAAYLSFRREQVLREFQDRQQALIREARVLNARLQKVTAQIDTATSPEQRRILRNEADQLASLVVQLGPLSFPPNPTVGTIVEPATLPTSPDGPTPALYVVLGVVLGLALGIVFAFLRERISDRPRNALELEMHLSAPVLALVPKQRLRRKKKDAGPSEEFRVLATNLAASPIVRSSHQHTLLIASAQAGEGKTFVAANLGMALAMAGHSVLVVSTDLRRPTDQPGLTDVLTKDVDPRSVLLTGRYGMKLLPSGRAIEGPSGVLGSEAMRGLLQRLNDIAEFLLIDGGSVLGDAVGLILATSVRGVVFVVNGRISDGPTLREATRQLDLLGVPIVGGVLNKVSPSKARRSYRATGYTRGPEAERPAVPAERLTSPQSPARSGSDAG
jgi:Mrp family chromosome partitioning ATPase/LPS O-antigen subunit length determinant protein (WzzB/FepE family)